MKLPLKNRIGVHLPSTNGKPVKEGDIAISITGFKDDPELVGAFNLAGNQGVRVQPSAGTIDSIRNSAVPKKKVDQIRKAQLWLEEDELLERLIGTKIDFTSIGFNLRCKPPEGQSLERLLSSGNSEEEEEESEESSNSIDSLSEEEKAELLAAIKFQQNLNLITQKWDFTGLVEDLLRDWFATDSMILYWKVEKANGTTLDSDASTPNDGALLPNVVNICALNPADVDWDNSLGIETMRVRIPVALKKKIEFAIEQVKKKKNPNAIEELKKGGVEQKWIDAVKGKKDFVLLRNEDGEYWIVKTKARKQHGLASPSMKNIFLPLETRKFLSEGDFATAFMMKHFIFHVKAGESIQQGPMAGSRKNWASKTDTDQLLGIVSKTSKSSRIATNHTVKFEFVFPPEEMFGDKKYLKVELRMFTWAGVTISVMQGSGEGQKAGTGFIGIKRMIANMVKARGAISWLLSEFFDDQSVKQGLNTPEGCMVTASFDENVLTEPRQLLDEVKFLVQEGIEDVRTAARELGRDPDAMKLGKQYTQAENEESKVWEPIVKKPGQMSDQEQGGGRPPNDETTPNEETRTQFGEE